MDLEEWATRLRRLAPNISEDQILHEMAICEHHATDPDESPKYRALCRVEADVLRRELNVRETRSELPHGRCMWGQGGRGYDGSYETWTCGRVAVASIAVQEPVPPFGMHETGLMHFCESHFREAYSEIQWERAIQAGPYPPQFACVVC